ncbi:PAS domain S-box protein [Balneolaceae bacterium YR4-1]|uniref:histidine kinase n=1 Tax=Halalkalibaculum roseum TaxID=2709311 RepID=A0A6M1SSA9_9BACT|nr:PAS domain S-box protein [Halalkalibaculum roseum]NGP77959.1 PAS domain S-box protein [Halalkalibaculum roseum]
MENKKYTYYGNQFKARVALAALKGTPLSELSEEHEVSEQEIKSWVKRLEDRAELIFLEEEEERSFPDTVDSEIRDYAALLRTTLEATPNGILVVDLDMNIIAYNNYCLKMWQVPEHVAAIGKLDKVMEYILPQLKYPEKYKEDFKSIYENPEAENRKILEFKDGRVFQRHSIPFLQSGEIKGRVTSFADITDFKQAQDKLERFSNLLNSITTNVNEGILRSTPEKGLIFVNDAFVRMFGYDSKKEVLQIKPEQFYADQKHRWELVEILKQKGKIRNEEVLFKRKDGSTFYGLENCTISKEGDQIYIDAVINDINERKITEEALRESEEKYRTILENIEDGYFETDLEGNFTFVNPAVSKILGYSESELLGMNNREYMDDENAKKVFSTFNEVFRNGVPQKGFDWMLQKSDGSKIYVEASFNLRRDAEGEPIGFRGIVRDITNRKEREEKIKDSLREKEVLLGEIHHRVKNNLAVISGLLYLQAEKTELEAGRNLLQQSQGRINSMALIHELLYENQNFSGIDPGKYIEQLINHISSNLNVRDKDIAISVQTADLQLDMNNAIPCALLINELLTNAYKYAFTGRDEGRISVTIYREEGYNHIEVKDDGVGIPDSYIRGEGEEGLGMSLVRILTQQLKGTLSIENDNGTQFRISFPAERDME